MHTREVVITGLGVVSPLDHGRGVDVFWKSLCQGVNAIQPIRSALLEGYNGQHAGQVQGFESYLQDLHFKEYSRCTKLFTLACQQAINDAKLASGQERMGVSCGTILGNIEAGRRYWDRLFLGDGVRETDLLQRYSLHEVPSFIAHYWNFKGPNLCISTTCASSADSIGLAFHEIKNGRADLMIAGGADMFSDIMFRGFSSLRALTKDGFVRPFAKNRTGLAVSEGAGVVILEELNHARSRKAKIYGQLIGYGSFVDGAHLLRPQEDGLGLVMAMKMAFEEGKISSDEIDYISAHGTGTFYNDLAEAKAIKSVFGGRFDLIPVTAIKSMLGHTMGACSVLEVISSLKILNYGVIPPTINYEMPDPECCLKIISKVDYLEKIDTAICLSAGFGGQNAALVLRKG